VKQRKPLPKVAVLGLIVVAAILVAFVGNAVLVKPQKSKLAKIDDQITDAQTKLTQYSSELASSRGQQTAKIRTADVYRLARAMPSTIDMPDLLLELDDLAKASGIRLDSITPGSSTDGNGFQTFPLTIGFTSDFYRATDFLFRLRTLVAVRHGQLEATGRLYSVTNVTIAPAQTGHELTVTATVQAYVYGTSAAAAAAAAAAAPPPATTTTDTTTTATTTSSSASAEGAP
jgi:Tfp pilus assembly protein PilO